MSVFCDLSFACCTTVATLKNVLTVLHVEIWHQALYTLSFRRSPLWTLYDKTTCVRTLIVNKTYGWYEIQFTIFVYLTVSLPLPLSIMSCLDMLRTGQVSSAPHCSLSGRTGSQAKCTGESRAAYLDLSSWWLLQPLMRPLHSSPSNPLWEFTRKSLVLLCFCCLAFPLCKI